MRLLLLATLCCSFAALAAEPPSAAAPARIALHAARMLDVDSGRMLRDPLVLVEGERIASVSEGGSAPAGVQVLELGDVTLLPGLIDVHVHITGDHTGGTGNYYQDILTLGPADEAVSAHVYAKRTLDAGFTTVRSVGSGSYIDVALRNAIDRGLVQGPRIIAATLPLGATGGHADNATGFAPNIEFHGETGVADGVDAVRARVRENVKHGADVIKFMASAGVLSNEASVGAPQYSQAEMDAIVDEAHRWGKKVAAHAHGTEAIKMAIRAGVDSVEHCSFIDDEGLKLAKQHGTWLVFDIYNDDYILAEYGKLGVPPAQIAKEKLVGRTQRENFRKAVQAGEKLAFGTDAGVYPHGWNAKQFAKEVEWGMSPLQAIRSATVNAAELLGWQDRVGAIKPGYYADMIAVAGDPLADVSVLEHVGFVMKGGAVVRGAQP
ncbi:MAG TPA: amidohydrolase family protein [Luteimonas sp.]|nr:amidohydrolase family protein [Luteimonas sp.]